MKKLRPLIRLLPAVPFFVLVAFFLLTPLINMLISSFRVPGTGAFTFQNYIDVCTKLIYTTAIKNSVRIAAVSSLIGLGISFFTALSLTRLSSRVRTRYMPILNMTQGFTGFPLAFSFMIMVGKSGFFVLLFKLMGWSLFDNYNLYSGNGVIPLFIYFAIPLGTLLLIPGFSAVQQEWIDASVLLRANGIQFWYKVGIPVVAPTLLGTLSMLFADSITTFTTIYMILTTNYPTLPIKISSMFSGDMKQQAELGSALSMVMVMIILATMFLTNMLRKLLNRGRAET